MKLLYVNCPLRIMIGYNDRSVNENYSDDKQLKILEESINKMMKHYDEI